MNEIPHIHIIMYHHIFGDLINTQNSKNKLGHETYNFIDDSTNVIYSKSPKDIEKYLNDFYIILDIIYSINKLKINNDKTEFLIVCKNRYRKDTKNIIMRADNHIVKQVDKIKILGFYIQSNLSNHSQIQKLISNLSNRLYNIKKIGSKTKFNSRLVLIKSIILEKNKLYTSPLN